MIGAVSYVHDIKATGLKGYRDCDNKKAWQFYFEVVANFGSNQAD